MIDFCLYFLHIPLLIAFLQSGMHHREHVSGSTWNVKDLCLWRIQ